MTYSRLLLFIFLGESFLLFHYTLATDIKTIMERTLPVYAMLSNAHFLNSTTCAKELINLRDAIDRRVLWSLKVIDSSGEPMSGFLYGNNYWLGKQSQCEDTNNRIPLTIKENELINNSRYRHVEDEFPPYKIKYFVAHFRHNSTLQYHIRVYNEDLVTLGMCLPATCSNDQLYILLEKVLRNRILIISDLYSIDLKLLEVKDLIDDYQWFSNKTFISIMFLLMLTCLLTLIGTTYDIVIYQKRLKKHAKLLQIYENTHSSQDKTIDNKQSNMDPENRPITLKLQNSISKVFLAFSIYSNTKAIFNTKPNDDFIPIIHGLKFLSMLWIIAAHTIFYISDYIDNKVISFRKSESLVLQVIANASLSVDTFFFVSGFLITYLYLNKQQESNKHRPLNYIIKYYFMNILKRFLRFTPSYMITMGIFEIISLWYSYTSQFYMTERSYDVCPKYWWRNILYIQNLFDRKNMVRIFPFINNINIIIFQIMFNCIKIILTIILYLQCMSWSWYLANDMQFFIITTFLLILSSRYFIVATCLLGLLFIASIIITGYISYIYNYVPTLDQQYHLLNVLYDPPWTRIGPHIVGIITGYIVIKLNKELRWKRKTIILFWILSSTCNILVLFGLWEKRISIISSAFYVALARTVWAVGLAWLVIACITNHGGIITKILSFKSWIPFSKLSYCAYLLNPIVINSIYLNRENVIHIDLLPNIILFFGNFVSTYICAYIFSMMFEMPYILLLKQVFNYNADRKK
ncbi:nose resistant to fluoxetine protein 6-like isoform X1 [Vespa crabro]|uniref:nose resistant to fluoxetine protein 6-like isoform X1 n=1 Tax=Vespa crabro TaxID=7445 RepID=UPI001F006668|nr:nose resistant to fluoxetine protein 6-like isoform X1 [Vespa crabro]XP_046830437.1 nose resistant to fluoxetine protein 6-like isoform X1 [Vespa crabro]